MKLINAYYRDLDMKPLSPSQLSSALSDDSDVLKSVMLKYDHYTANPPRKGAGTYQLVAGALLFFVSVAGVAMLIISSIYYRDYIPLNVSEAVVIIGFFPILGLSLFNIFSAWKLKAKLDELSAFRNELALLQIAIISRYLGENVRASQNMNKPA